MSFLSNNSGRLHQCKNLHKAWYIRRCSDLLEAITKGKVKTATEHNCHLSPCEVAVPHGIRSGGFFYWSRREKLDVIVRPQVCLSIEGCFEPTECREDQVLYATCQYRLRRTSVA